MLRVFAPLIGRPVFFLLEMVEVVTFEQFFQQLATLLSVVVSDLCGEGRGLPGKLMHVVRRNAGTGLASG